MRLFGPALILIFILSLPAVSTRTEEADESADTEGPASASKTEPAAPPGSGMLRLRLDGNRDFCVRWNEIELEPGTVRPRQERAGPLITTFGYKYQISASRRGSGSVTKLLESPATNTAYQEKKRPPKRPPGPRLATPEDRKRERNPWNVPKVTRWLPDNACTTLKDEYNFPLSPGQYDIYLGFDLLTHTGQWVPLQSDYVTRVRVEAGQVTDIAGTVDYTDGVRTVELRGTESSKRSRQP